MRLPCPPRPPLPDDQLAERQVPLRYEDLSQDGRLLVGTLGPLYGSVVWGSLLARGPVAAAAREQGVVPILTRLTLEGEGGPFSPANPLRVAGGYDLAHSVDERGEVARVHLRIWAEVRGPTGHAYDQHGAPGAEIGAGRVFAEHVFTRLFAPPAERRVVRLDLPGLPGVPPTRCEPLAPPAMLEAPAGAEALDEPGVEPSLALFSLGHTDSNQHVNSLVYPKMFEEMALQRLRRLGLPTALLVRHADCLYRKPFFAGEAAEVRMQVFRAGEGFGVVGAFLPEGSGPGGRPSVALRLLLTP